MPLTSLRNPVEVPTGILLTKAVGFYKWYTYILFLYKVKSLNEIYAKSAYCKSLRQKTAWVHIAKKMRVRKQNPFHLEISQKERLIEQLDALSDTFFRSCLCLAQYGTSLTHGHTL